MTPSPRTEPGTFCQPRSGMAPGQLQLRFVSMSNRDSTYTSRLPPTARHRAIWQSPVITSTSRNRFCLFESGHGANQPVAGFLLYLPMPALSRNAVVEWVTTQRKLNCLKPEVPRGGDS